MSITLLFAMSPVDSTFTVNLSCAYLFLFFFTKKKHPSALSLVSSVRLPPLKPQPLPLPGAAAGDCLIPPPPCLAAARHLAVESKVRYSPLLPHPSPSSCCRPRRGVEIHLEPGTAADCSWLCCSDCEDFFFRGVWFDIGESNPSLHLRIAASVTGTAP